MSRGAASVVAASDHSASSADLPVADLAATIGALRSGGDDAVIAAARGIAPKIAERADHYDLTAAFPSESFEDLWASGLTSLSLAQGLGGVGASLYAMVRVQQIISAADASLGFILKWHHVRLRNFASWPEKLRQLVVAEVLAAPVLHSGLRGEPLHGSIARGGVPGTKAKLIVTANGSRAWQINGHKMYGTGGLAAKWLQTWAATVPEDGEVNVGWFLIPRTAPGVEIVSGSWNQLGMRATVSNDVILRDVVVPYDHAIQLTPFASGQPFASRPAAADNIDWGSVLEAALYLGIAQGARDWLVAYLNRRAPGSLGAPLATLERFKTAVGEIELLNYTSRSLIEGLAQRIDRPSAPLGGQTVAIDSLEPGLVKTAAVRNAIAATDLGLSLVGNPGLAYRNPLQRFYRDALCGRVHEPQADVILLAAGRQALNSAAVA
jgi:alkylation response protein AidB-like acyl-CoA dehydrogenase